MIDPTTALTTAIENSTKVGNTPLFSTVIDRLLGFKISEWKAQGDAIKKQITDGYEEAKKKGLGIQYVSAFRANTNLINIGAKAAPYIQADTQSNIEMDNDVFWGLIEHSKDISNEEMQDLIAKIIAGEYNTPGTYTMSTLQTIKMLGKSELELLEKISSLLINQDQIPHEIFNLGDDVKDIMGKIGIDFGSLQTLQSLGLFLPNEMVNSIPNPERKNFKINYFDKGITFSPENDNFNPIKVPSYFGLSQVGKQILRHLNPPFLEEYYLWIKEHYKIPNYRLI
jgi:hypothetical protein